MRSARPASRPPAAGQGPAPARPPEAASPAREACAEPGEPLAPSDVAPGEPAGEASIAAWFRAHVERVWRIVARLGVPPHSVEDIVQETFITANRRRADIGQGQERRFLVATAVRLCSNYRKKAHVRREVAHEQNFDGDASPLLDAEQLLIAKQTHELLERLLAELPEAQRAVFVLYELEELSVPEIASLLELPLGTVSSRIWRARARFSELTAPLQRGEQEEEHATP